MPVVKTLQKHKMVLDTHVLLWLMEGNSILSPQFQKTIRSRIPETSSDHALLVSIISIWEIGMLVEKKRILLEMDTLDWIEKVFQSNMLQLVPITPKIAILSSRLPGEVHGDPADCLLIATAHEENAVLVTCDEKILKYGKDRFVHVHDPR